MDLPPHGYRTGCPPQTALKSAQAHLSGVPLPDGAESSPERRTLRRIQAQALGRSARDAGHLVQLSVAGPIAELWAERLASRNHP